MARLYYISDIFTGPGKLKSFLLPSSFQSTRYISLMLSKPNLCVPKQVLSQNIEKQEIGIINGLWEPKFYINTPPPNKNMASWYWYSLESDYNFQIISPLVRNLEKYRANKSSEYYIEKTTVGRPPKQIEENSTWLSRHGRFTLANLSQPARYRTTCQG